MRPDEWLAQCQMPWMRAVLDQNANQRAIHDVNQEAAGYQVGNRAAAMEQ